VAAWLRHRAAEELKNGYDEETVSGYVQGHIDSTEGEKPQRISYVPLPTIYGKHADGWIRRAMIVEPAGMSGDISDTIGRKLTGAVLTGTDGTEQCCPGPPVTAADIERDAETSRGRYHAAELSRSYRAIPHCQPHTANRISGRRRECEGRRFLTPF